MHESRDYNVEKVVSEYCDSDKKYYSLQVIAF